MAISVFLSTVSDEFRAYRDQLVHDLTRHNVAVKVQEDFKDLGGDTLDKLDVYIAHCDAVVHLVGDMCGAAADETQQQALLAKHVDLQSKLPPLGEALTTGGLHSLHAMGGVARALSRQAALRRQGGIRPRRVGRTLRRRDASRAAQVEHLARLKAPSAIPLEFASPDDLAKQVLASGILDLLAEDKAAQASVPRQEAKIDEILRRLSQIESVPLDTLRAILGSMGEAAASYNAGEIEQKLAAKAV